MNGVLPMTQPKELDGAANPRAFFGSEVRRLRTTAALSQERLAKLIYISPDYVAKIEKADRFPTDKELPQRLDAALGSDGHLMRLFELAERSKGAFADYFTLFTEMEKTAARIETYSPLLVPGLLQTAAYARAVFSMGPQYRPDDEIEKMVDARCSRARILDDPGGVHVWLVMDEAVLHRPMGNHAVMREQVHHIVGLAKARRIGVQVMPFGRAHELMNGGLVMLHFHDQPAVAYIDALYMGHVLHDPETVALCQMSYDHVRAAALSPDASLEFLEAAMEDYTT